ncbi:Crp/Fnr family transcriptional regulator [Chryseobacterium sp. GMJ5]|uniref:Crp/Fnr family transcriptional regulator n=1 Tax=Chryseobacterium gilvum TaxID=2976534 RepID=A0ABT2VV07_9FLAO|nr:Crp/Fnr family transcriptional regulator [Chryseobacterium gilvum]MCU7613701.1 Crp/Fnr family transcriptional regulator [Chryseobacterium gilvum]
MIIENLLLSYGGDYKKFETNEIIFKEGDSPAYYFQIASGKVKINNQNEKGKEFIQGILHEGHSIAQAALFINKTYPVNAVAIENCDIIRLSRQNYLELLKENPEFYDRIILSLSEDMHYRYLMMQSMSFQNPESRLKTIMDYLKDQYTDHSRFSFQIPYTRQQLASLTGLSVETVIRVIKNMEKNDVLKIQNRKILY